MVSIAVWGGLGAIPVPRSGGGGERAGALVIETGPEVVEDGELILRHNVGVGIGLDLSPYPCQRFLQDVAGRRICLAIPHRVVASNLQRITDT